MRGDFSAWNKDRSHNFRGTLHQQGRVLLDRDWNAQTEITGEWQETAARDAFGAGVAAVPAEEPLSFKVIKAEVSGGLVKVSLKKGRVWADGLLAELGKDAEPPALPAGVDAIRTATYLGPPIQTPAGQVSQLPNGLHDAVILETWLKELSPFQDPDLLIEPALGGVDTTERLQTAFRFRLYRMAAGDTCDSLIPKLKDDFSAKGKLTAELTPTVTIGGDCPVVESGGFTGFEHRLYRIEIADTDRPAPEAYFKWSHFNGGLVGTGDFDAATRKVTIHGNKNAIVYSGSNNFYLEALDYVTTIGCWKVVYGAKATLAADGTLSLPDPAASPGDIFKGTIPPVPTKGKRFFRLWDGIERVANFTAKKDLPDNLGILIQFEAEGVGQYTPSDFWTFEVRAGGIGNPLVLVPNLPPQGIFYHRVPLAIIHWNGPGETEPVVCDCRKKFRPLTDLNGCCTYEVGDGIHSIGDLDSIEQAVKQLPAQGGRICVLPGVHKANLNVLSRDNIHITGCGDQSIVHPTLETPDQPIFHFSSCRNIKIDNLTLITHTGAAVEVEDASDAANASVGITIEHNRIFALTHAINIRVKNELAGKNAIRIRDNIIAMWDLEGGDAAIFSGADDVFIHNNEISVVPAPDPQDPDDPRDPDGPDGELYDPCSDLGQYYGQALWIMQVVNSTLRFLTLAWAFKKFEYKAKGGIQIGGGSEMVRITSNRITGGYGNGITLGDLPVEGGLGADFKGRLYVDQLDATHQQYLEQNFLGFLYEIAIENNYIAGMGLSGIGVAAFLHSENIGLMISIDEITIRENHITHCANQVPDEKPESMLRESGFGGIVLASCENVVIAHNKIQDNGRYENQAVCGVLIVYGEDVDISNNRIINNGPLGQVNGQALDRGLRGGIVVLLSFKQLVYQFIQNKGFTRPDGIPAVKVHDNIVVQPMGQALYLMAFGPVSVVGNQFTTQGADYKINPFSIIAGAVLIMNLGVSQDLMAAMFLKSFRYVATGNQMLFTGESALAQAPAASAALKFLYLPSGNVMYTGNQTTLDLQDEVINLAFSAQAIVSLDDVAYNSNQSEVRSLFDILLTDVALIGATVRANDNRFQEGFTITLNSLISVGFMNMAATNQATHCIQVLGPPAFTAAPGNSILYKTGPCADYGKVIGEYVAVKGLVAG